MKETYQKSVGDEMAICPEKDESERRVISFPGNVCSLEITEKCRTGCEVCYTAGRAHLAGDHVPVEVLASRIDWIRRHTDARYITLIGGDPLLHPELESIIDYARLRGFGVDIITSGVTSGKNETERRNLELVLEKFREGNLGVDLSLHPGINEKQFKKIIQIFKADADKRRASLGAQKSFLETQLSLLYEKDPNDNACEKVLVDQLKIVCDRLGEYTVFSTVTLGPGIAADFQKFKEIFRFLVEECDDGTLSKMTVDGEKSDIDALIEEKFAELQRHFAPFGQSSPFSKMLTVTGKGAYVWKIRLWGAILISKKINAGRVVIRSRRPMGNEASASACPAMMAEVDDKSHQVKLNSSLVRADGQLVPAPPGCIEMKKGLANVDGDDSPDEIFRSVTKRLEGIDKLIHKIDALHQSERPTQEKGCASCPFDIACNICLNQTSPNDIGLQGWTL